MEKKVILAFLYILLFPALLLIISGDLLWPAGWVFSFWFFLPSCTSTGKTRRCWMNGINNPVPATRKAGTNTSFMGS